MKETETFLFHSEEKNNYYKNPTLLIINVLQMCDVESKVDIFDEEKKLLFHKAETNLTFSLS